MKLYNLNYKHIVLGCLTLFATNLMWSQKILTGQVVDAETGTPIPGASIINQNSTQGVAADFDGNFSIEADIGTILRISSIGFESVDHTVLEGDDNLIIQLSTDATGLDEVVVVGYGSQRKSDIIGAVASVKAETVQSIPLNRTDEVLQGQIAGVQINNNDASPNGDISIRIRGVSSVTGGSNPLIVIDGLQGANLSDVHPNDIASIEVLKDASATAIYGSRGASGVVLITTKSKGKEGGIPKLTYNGYVTTSTIRKKLDLLNPLQYANYINQNREARGLPVVFSETDVTAFRNGEGTDWQDEIYRQGTTQNHHLTLSGIESNISYNIAGDFIDTKGIVQGSHYQRFSLRPNLALTLDEKLKININSFVSRSKDNPTVLNQRDREGSPVFASFRYPPTKLVYQDDGSYSYPGGGAGPATEYNPLALALEPIRDQFSNRFILNPSVNYKPTKNLEFKISGFYNSIDDENNYYYNEKVVGGNDATRKASITNSRFVTIQNSNLITYIPDIGEEHFLKLTGLFEQQKITFNENSMSAENFLSNATTYNNMELGSSVGTPYSNREESSLQSLMARVNYIYKNKYILTLTAREDAASVFAENNKKGLFPSAAIGWNISQEEFLKDYEALDFLKLRFSYGEVGNAAISPYQSLSKLESGANFSFNGKELTTGVSLSTQAPNPDLKWETTLQKNFGIDTAWFANRLGLTVDYYQKNTRDLLLAKELTQASGFQTQLVNAGEVENKGFEVLLTGIPVKKAQFEWNSTITFSNNKNKVISLAGDDSEIRLGGAGLPGFSDAIWLEVGQPIGLIRGYEYDGVWKSDEEIIARVYNATPGSPRYVDQNNDGLLNDKDVVNIANALPDYIYSWNNTFSIQNFDFNVLLIGVQGNDIYNIGRSLMESQNEATGVNILNAWTPDNENTDIPGHNAVGDIRNSSRWVEDGSYVRVKNIILGYNFSSSQLQSFRFDAMRLYLSASNLFTFTNYSGFDPEANNAASIASSRSATDAFAGVDLATYPSQKRFTLGIDIKF